MTTHTSLTQIIARDIYAAAGFTPTPAQEADLQARADAMRALTGRPGPRRLNVPVHTPDGALIGHVTFTR